MLPPPRVLCTWKNKYLFKGRASSGKSYISDKQRGARKDNLSPGLCARMGVGSSVRVVRKRKHRAEWKRADAH